MPTMPKQMYENDIDEFSAILDSNTDNEDYTGGGAFNMQARNAKRDRQHNNQEFAPLLDNQQKIENTLSTIQDDDEELASPPHINPMKKQAYWFFSIRQPQFRHEKGQAPLRYCCCFSRRKVCLITCFSVILIPLITFVIFCAVYFSPASLPTIIPANIELINSDSTRLLTFNMFMRPPGIKNNENDYKDERLNYIITHILPSYDIITIQEAFAYANRRIDRFLKAAFDQGFYYHVASPRHYPWDLAGDGGLLILSRFPIKKADRIEFSRGVHSDWLSYKGALHALIELDTNHLVHVYTTHTQASYDNKGEFNLDDTKVRLRQFADVHQFMRDTAKDDNYPILLMGDLNVDAATHNNSKPIDIPSYESSLAYTMMMDVLRGKGTDLELLNNNHTRTETNKTLLYMDEHWRLDSLTDMVHLTFGYHPVTFGDYKRLSNGTFIPAETVLTSHNQLLTVQSIDRLLWSDNRGSNATIRLSNVTVEHCFVQKNESLPFTQISDHYGLSALLYTK